MVCVRYLPLRCKAVAQGQRSITKDCVARLTEAFQDSADNIRPLRASYWQGNYQSLAFLITNRRI